MISTQVPILLQDMLLQPDGTQFMTLPFKQMFAFNYLTQLFAHFYTRYELQQNEGIV